MIDCEYERRRVLNQLKHTSRCGSKLNDFSAFLSETDNHIRKKFELWLKLRRHGYEVLCEPVFESGIRMDILAFKEGLWTNFEVLETETKKELAEKTKSYPNICLVPIHTLEEISKLTLD
jgi:hypothetical protein